MAELDNVANAPPALSASKGNNTDMVFTLAAGILGGCLAADGWFITTGLPVGFTEGLILGEQASKIKPISSTHVH